MPRERCAGNSFNHGRDVFISSFKIKNDPLFSVKSSGNSPLDLASQSNGRILAHGDARPICSRSAIPAGTGEGGCCIARKSSLVLEEWLLRASLIGPTRSIYHRELVHDDKASIE